MKDAAEKALRDVRVHRVAELTGGRANADLWARALCDLAAAGLGVLPVHPPSDADDLVLVFPLQGVFGRLLRAAAESWANPTMEAAARVAAEARPMLSLTVAPARRHRAPGPLPPPGAAGRALLHHRVEAEGGGFLALPTDELASLLGRLPRRGVLPVPAPRTEAVTVWTSVTAVAIALSGVNHAHRLGSPGVQLCLQSLRTAAGSLEPAPLHLEWC